MTIVVDVRNNKNSLTPRVNKPDTLDATQPMATISPIGEGEQPPVGYGRQPIKDFNGKPLKPGLTTIDRLQPRHNFTVSYTRPHCAKLSPVSTIVGVLIVSSPIIFLCLVSIAIVL